MTRAAEVELEVAGRVVRVTSADKVMFPERGETKLDLVEYYLAIEEPLMRAVGGRPVLMQRFPNGAGGSSFFQKRVPEGAPESLRTALGPGTEVRALDPVSMLIHGPADSTTLRRVSQWCEEHDVLPETLTLGQRNLEDVFLELTGRELSR